MHLKHLKHSLLHSLTLLEIQCILRDFTQIFFYVWRSQCAFSLYIHSYNRPLFPKQSASSCALFFFQSHSFSSLSVTVMTSLRHTLIGCILHLRGRTRVLIGQTPGDSLSHSSAYITIEKHKDLISMFLHACCIRQKHSYIGSSAGELLCLLLDIAVGQPQCLSRVLS